MRPALQHPAETGLPVVIFGSPMDADHGFFDPVSRHRMLRRPGFLTCSAAAKRPGRYTSPEAMLIVLFHRVHLVMYCSPPF